MSRSTNAIYEVFLLKLNELPAALQIVLQEKAIRTTLQVKDYSVFTNLPNNLLPSLSKYTTLYVFAKYQDVDDEEAVFERAFKWVQTDPIELVSINYGLRDLGFVVPSGTDAFIASGLGEFFFSNDIPAFTETAVNPIVSLQVVQPVPEENTVQESDVTEPVSIATEGQSFDHTYGIQTLGDLKAALADLDDTIALNGPVILTTKSGHQIRVA